MLGIDQSFNCHILEMDLNARLVIQRKIKLGEERQRVMIEEIAKHLKAEFIREVSYTTWLANVVMVKKYYSKWRMCTDFTDLNKAYSNDSYSLTNINQLVDATFDYIYLSFMDAYSDYN